MGLPWVRLDTQFATNPKVLELTSAGRWRAAFAYVAALAYCGAHGTDGYIPEASLFLLHATKREADELVKAGLWHTDVGGWTVNGWADFQQSSAETQERKHKYRELANRRWHPEWFEGGDRNA